MSADSVIHDIGYQRYTGPRLGRAYAVRSLYVHGVRTVFGLGRSAKAKIFPWAMIAIIVFVAVIDIAIRVLVHDGSMPISYLGFCDDLSFVLLLYIAAVAPELVSRDLRNGLLPLYFSRPMSRADYAWAKLGALLTGVWLVYAGPLFMIFFAGLFTVDSWRQRVHEFSNFVGGLGLAAIYAVVFGALGLVISAWIRRRMVASAVIVGYFLFTTAVGEAVGNIVGGDLGKAVGEVFGPPGMVLGLKEWIYRVHGTVASERGPLFLAVTVLLTGAAIGLLQVRYRRVSA
jgi:ABC-2 type transport system permease protein